MQTIDPCKKITIYPYIKKSTCVIYKQTNQSCLQKIYMNISVVCILKNHLYKKKKNKKHSYTKR